MAISWSTLIGVVAFSAILYVIFNWISQMRKNKAMSNIPFVREGYLPIFGHALTLVQGRPWKLVNEWHKSYGPIYRFRVFNDYYISVAESELLKDILRTNVNDYEKDIKGAYHHFMCLLGNGLVTSHGELWREQRSLMSAVFNVEILGDVAEMSLIATDKLSSKLEKIATNSPDTVIDLGEELRRLTLQVIGGAILSLPPDECDRVFPRLYLPIVDEGNKRVWAPWREYFPSLLFPHTRDYNNAIKELNDYVHSCIDSRIKKIQTAKKNGENYVQKDILDRILFGTEEQQWSNPQVINSLADAVKV